MSWTTEHLQSALEAMRRRRGDTTSIEVKQAAGGLPQLADTLCAFANMPNGGTIILGVDEDSGAFTVTGVNDVASLEAGLIATARQSVSPSPQISVETHTLDGAEVLIAHVAPLRVADKPATVDGRAYLRKSDGDYVMQEHELRMIDVDKLHASEQVDYDLQPARGSSAADLTPDLVASYLTSARARDRRLSSLDDDQILRMTGVLTAGGEPTLAGLYALGTYPQGHFPSLEVTAAVQLPDDGSGARNRNLEYFTGPLPVLLDELMGWVRQNLDSIQQYRNDGHMESVTELPLSAVRELIANALVHRDLGPNTLGRGKSIQIRLNPRNLFIQSPGGLRGVSLAQLKSEDHAQAAVNQRLYQMAKKLTTPDGGSIIEGEGGGIREVFRAAQRRGLPQPQLIDTGVQFKALLWRPEDPTTPLKPALSSPAPETATADDDRAEPLPLKPPPKSSAPTVNEPRVLAALHRRGPLSIADLASETDLSWQQVRYALRRPMAEGLVVMRGGQGRKDTRYALVAPDVI